MYLCHTIENKRLDLTQTFLFFSYHLLQACHVRPSPTTRLYHDTYTHMSCYKSYIGTFHDMDLKIFFFCSSLSRLHVIVTNMFFFKVTTHTSRLLLFTLRNKYEISTNSYGGHLIMWKKHKSNISTNLHAS